MSQLTGKVYITNDGSGTVSVLKGATSTVTTTITVVFGPRGVAVNPRAGQVDVANSGSNTVSVITPAR